MDILSRTKLNKNGCLEWTGAIRSKSCGYGSVKFRGKVHLAHRVSFILNYGEIPKGILVIHSCDNKKCINPVHLSLGTHHDNSKDAYDKGISKMPIGKRFKAGKEHPFAKIFYKDVADIKFRRIKGESYRSIAKSFKVDHGRIWQICNGKNVPQNTSVC